jgi:hypothetical protein
MPEAGLSSFEVLIVGLVRDCGKSLAQEIKTLNSAFGAFKKVSFFLVESDSKDDSLSILAELKSTIPNFDFTSLGELNNAIPDRIERIAYCRNVYLNYVKRSTNNYDYTVVADLDGVNKLLTKDGVATCWERTDWDACTANQLGPYYDVYALRANGWVERDCWNEARSLYASGLNPVKSWIKAIRSKQRVIQESSDWIEVKSAFGGLAIYKQESFIKGNYSTFTEDEDFVSEHVPFNLNIVEDGSKLYINPALINFSFNEHNDFNKVSRRAKLALKYLLSLISPSLTVRLLMPGLSAKSSPRMSL